MTQHTNTPNEEDAPVSERLRGGPLQVYLTLVFLVALLVVCLLFINRLWPGSRWVNSWYGREGEIYAALKVSAQQNELLTEARGLVAREFGSNDTMALWSSAERERVNRALAYAHELQLYWPEEPVPFCLSGVTHGAEVLLTFGGQLKVTSTRLRNALETLYSGQTLLSRRVAILSETVGTPSLGDFLVNNLPGERGLTERELKIPCAFFQKFRPQEKASKPTPSEIMAYGIALAEHVKVRPISLFNHVEAHYLVLILLFGVLGSSLRAVASLVRYIGTEKIKYRWLPYYWSLPLIGGGLALAFYAVLRGGFMSVANPASEVTNLYSCVGLSVLVGIASREALQQIQLVAANLFSKADSDGEGIRKPVITRLERRADGMLLVHGRDLAGATLVTLNGKASVPQQSGSTLITVPITDATIRRQPCKITLVVETPSGQARFESTV